MKLIELQTEKSKVESLLREGSYIEVIHVKECDDAKKALEVKQRYTEDQRLLKKLDSLNNVLKKAYATTYIDLRGDRLSLATAKEYLEEIQPKKMNSSSSIFDEEIIINNKVEFDKWENLHMCIMSKCSTMMGDRFLLEDARRAVSDPLKLADRKAEFETNQRNWCFELMEEISIAEATTDIVFNY